MSSGGSSGRRGGPWMEASPSVEGCSCNPAERRWLGQHGGGGSGLGCEVRKGGAVSDGRVFSLRRVLSPCEGARGGRPSRYRSLAFRGAVWAGGINVEWLVIS